MTTVGDDRAQALQRYLASRSRGQEEGEARDGVRPRLPGEAAVLSFGQEQIWAHEQLVPERTIYNEAFTLVRRGPLEIPVFARAFAEIVRRHEIWRTTFRAEDGIPVPVVHPSMAIPIDVIDLRGVVGAGSRDANVEVDRGVAAAEAQARKPFDLERGPLVRVTVCHLSDDHHLIYMVVHQIVFDGVSIYGVFLREIAALYDAFAAGEPSPLPELKLQYGDFAAWERRTFDEEQRRRNLEAVVRRLEGAPSGIDVGLDRQRPARRRYRGDEEQLLIPAPIRDALAAVAREAGTTLFVALSGLYAVLLARYSGRDDLLIGTVASSRTDARLEPLIGFFLNTLVLRADLRAIPGGEHDDATAAQPEADPDLSFRGLLTRLRQDTIDALSHAEVPFSELVAALGRSGETRANPLFDALLVLEPQGRTPPPGWSMAPMTIGTGIARLDLHLQLEDRPEGIRGRLRYDRALFDPPTAARMARHLEALARSVAADPDGNVLRLPIDPDGSIAAHFSGDVGRVRVPQPPADLRIDAASAPSLVEAIDRVAERFTGRPFMISGGTTVTYGELRSDARRVARALRREGEGRVALLMGRDAAMVAAMLGALRAGRAYVPLDPGHPSPRLQSIVDDSEATAVLVDRAHLAQAREIAGGRPILEIESLEPGSTEDEPAVPAGNAEAYVLYTSGSTGRPKGVVQTQENVRYFASRHVEALGLHAGDRMSLIASYTFDAAVVDIYSALLSGAALVPLDVAALGPRGLAAAIAREGITVYHSVPTILRYLAGVATPDQLSRVRAVVLGGEAVRVSDLESFRRLLPDSAVFVNLYGSTESSVALLYLADRTTPARAAVPIGRPIPGTHVTLLDRGARPTEIRGEIAITSPHVAVGYWNQENVTRAAFTDNGDGTRTYRTGDLARSLSDGSFEYLGRRDLQVKVRGVRVEVPEVEAALLGDPAVRECAVAAITPRGQEPRLAAWIVPRDPGPLDLALLGDALRRRLPEAMIPTAFAVVDSLPVTRTGKVDRAALAAIPTEPPHTATDRAPDAFEQQVVDVWSEVLGIPVRLDDDFFAIGGHSLLAARVADRLERRLGIRVDLPTLLERRTPARLAAALRGEGDRDSTIVAVQPNGLERPLFVAPGAASRLLYLRHLARRLGHDQPLYAFYPRDRATAASGASIEELAARYVRDLRQVQPAGPYRILGYSFGGIVAFEVARQLLEEGEDIELLALVDSILPGQAAKPPGIHVTFLPRRLRNQASILRLLSPRERRRYLRQRLRIALRSGRIHARAIVDARVPGLPDLVRWPDDEGADERRWMARDAAAWRQYRPRPIPARILFLWGAHAQLPPSVHDTRSGWADVAQGGLEVRPIPGSHLTVVLEPLVKFVAAELRQALGGH